MEFLDIPIFDDDFYKMLFRFSVNMLFLTIIIRFIYFRITKCRDYLFTYFMISIIVFLLCFTLKKYELDLGMALGLFAIFGIIRYRTDTIPIKEMTYLFIVIGVSVINSLANSKMSYFEIFGANILITLAILLLEKYWLQTKEFSKRILYEKIENVKPDNKEALITDIQERTGLNVTRVHIESIDFLKDTATIIIYYKEE